MASKGTEIAAIDSPTSCVKVSFTLPSKRVSEWNNFFKILIDWKILNWFLQRHHLHPSHLASTTCLFIWFVQKFWLTISRLIFLALTRIELWPTFHFQTCLTFPFNPQRADVWESLIGPGGGGQMAHNRKSALWAIFLVLRTTNHTKGL